MNFTCSKCKKEWDFKEDHQEMNFPGLQLFLCKECIHRERSKREDFYGMKGVVEDGILTLENGKRFDLNQPIEDAVL